MKIRTLLAAAATTGLAITTAHAGNLNVGFQNTVASENFEGDGGTFGDVGPARYFHISVNPNNAGYASYIANDASGNPIGAYTRDFSDPVVAHSFIGGGPNDELTPNTEAGGRVSWSTVDTSFDSFGQNQKKVWIGTDPGADFNAPANEAEVGTTTHDTTATGYRSFGQSTATVDVSGLQSGTLNVFYGAFGGVPEVSAILRDTDGNAPDIVLDDLHLNEDSANRTEFYVAEVDFETDGGYDTIVWDYYQAAGADPEALEEGGNGRSGGVVLTGVVPEPSSLALLGLGGLLIARRRRG